MLYHAQETEANSQKNGHWHGELYVVTTSVFLDLHFPPLLDRYSADAWYIASQLSYSIVNYIYEIGNQT